MPNQLSSSGLITASQAELLAQYSSEFQTIYGASINIGPETPDGQLIFIFIQSVLDVENLLTQIYNTFDPDNAIGTVLDQRVAINGIQRQAGTFTQTEILLVTNQSVNLYGLDQSAQPVYTIADGAGNDWQLQNTVLGLTSGSNTLVFQSATPGAITPVPNSITIPVTIVLGVVSINNPTTYLVLGINEETDAQLKVRRQISVSLPSQGYLAGLLAALENISGVTFAAVKENNSGTTIGSGPLAGLPGHSIWVIVAGSGATNEIANAIYTKRNAGAGMYNSGDAGAQMFTITQVDGSLFTVYWDDVVQTPLFIRMTVASLNGSTPPNIPAIRGSLPLMFMPGVFGQVNANEVSTLVQDIDANTLAYPVMFSSTISGSQSLSLLPPAANNQFAVTSPDTIIIPIYISGSQVVLSVNSSNAVVSTLTVLNTTGTQTFIANGGYSTYHWSLQSNASGGSIGSLSGIYAAGSTPGVDIVKVFDTDPTGSNVAICTVTVT